MIIKINGRLAFPQLFTAATVNGQGKPKFSANIIFEPNSDAHKQCSAAILAVANAKWPGKGAEIVKSLGSDKLSLRDGDKHLDKNGTPYSGFAGMKYVVAKNSARPQLVDRNRAPVTEESGALYAGCYVLAHVEFYAHEKPGQGKGVFCTLAGVQKVKDGDSFGGSTVSSLDAFDDLGVEEESVADLV